MRGPSTVECLSTEDLSVIISETGEALAARVENLSSVAVVVANYEALAPYEASYGLENNILNDLYASFIPRSIWNEKPPTSDARAYSDLYFNYGENSFAISPFADFLRNFGPIGVPLGMLVLGIDLRLIYSALTDNDVCDVEKGVLFFTDHDRLVRGFLCDDLSRDRPHHLYSCPQPMACESHCEKNESSAH